MLYTEIKPKLDEVIVAIGNISGGGGGGGAVTVAQLPAALGQGTMAQSLTVAIASNQTAVPVSAASLPLPTGASTEATLSTLNGKVTACNTGAVVLGAGSALACKVGIDQTTPGTTNGVTDNGPGWTSANGIAGVPFTSADATSVVSVTSAPTGGQKLVITDLVFSVGTAMTVTFKEETSGTVIAGPFYMTANSTLQITTRSRRKLPAADKKLQVIASVAGNISVNAFYYSEA